MERLDFELLNSVLEKINNKLDENVNIENIDFSEANAFLFYHNKLQPVKNYSKINLDILEGIDYQKKELLKNTEKFVNRKLANHAVLWGERGTGKSSLVKAMLPIFYSKGLKLIQVLKEDILNIFKLYPLIEKESYRFIILIDDLSFEAEDKEFKEFKTIIDGGVFEIPENVLFYVTSNKKNLVPIKFSDRESDYSRISDILEEKLSLIDRFGLRLGFYKFDKNTYLKIVEKYAQLYEINLPLDELYSKAMFYAREIGAMNGRTALNFIKSL